MAKRIISTYEHYCLKDDCDFHAINSVKTNIRCPECGGKTETEFVEAEEIEEGQAEKAHDYQWDRDNDPDREKEG